MDRDQEVERDVDTSSVETSHDADRSFDRPGDRSSTVRDDIRDAIRETEASEFERKEYEEAAEPREEKPKERKARRGRKQLDSDVEAADAAFDSQDDPGEADTEAEPHQAEQGPQDAPASWTKEARKQWSKASARIRQEVLKREADIQKGVQQLQARYGEIDAAIAPYHQAIQQFNKTPGQAVAQLFGWFDALAKNPDQAFPALLQSYRYNPEKLVRNYLANRGIDPNILNNARLNPVQQNNQRLANLERAYQVQQQAYAQQQQAYARQQQEVAQRQHDENIRNTETMLGQWAQSKPHFEKVRQLMGHLLTPDPTTGQAPVPLKRDGTVDLDKAYAWAVRAQIGERVAADREYASSARRKTSLTASAPGYNNGRAERGPPRGTSVRESLKQAISELSDR